MCHHNDDREGAPVKPAYDLADPYDAYRFLDASRTAGGRPGDGWAHPDGPEHLWAYRVAQVYDTARHRRTDQRRAPTADEALAALAVLTELRGWLARMEPELIGAARDAGATWEQLAPVLRVSDRRAAHRRAARLSAAGTAVQGFGLFDPFGGIGH